LWEGWRALGAYIARGGGKGACGGRKGVMDGSASWMAGVGCWGSGWVWYRCMVSVRVGVREVGAKSAQRQ